jgi:hypothetical protein
MENTADVADVADVPTFAHARARAPARTRNMQ